LSNVIKDHRARLGSMREKNDYKKASKVRRHFQFNPLARPARQGRVMVILSR
jgi:hypothetical protein